MTIRANKRLEVRLSTEQRNLIKRAADMQGRSVSDFVVEAAMRAVEAESVMRLSPAAQEIVAQALLNLPASNAALMRAFERNKRLPAE